MDSERAGGGERRGDEDALEARVRAALDELRGGMQLDGCDVVFDALSPDGVLRLRVTGRHTCCPMAVATLQAVFANALRRRFAQITDVICTR